MEGPAAERRVKSGDAGGTVLAAGAAKSSEIYSPGHSNVRRRGRLRKGGRPDCRSRLSYSNIGGANYR
jgi:hypothetical protein